MKIIGLTGGIASGKSTVSNYLKNKNIPVIDCDKESRQVLCYGENGYLRTVETFGKEILAQNGEIDRKKLASIVFNDKKQIKKLNEIIHPEVIDITCRYIEMYRKNGEDMVIVDAPLLIESGMNKICDEIWVVYTSPEIQLQRAMIRDSATRSQVEERIKNQFSFDEKKKFADRLIQNDGTIEELYNRVDEILNITERK